MNICVYTCITGNYDKINELKEKEQGIDYYLFTNNKNIKSNTWKVIYVEDNKLNNIKLARKIKILGHEIIKKNYDVSVWIDGNIIIKKSIKQFVEKFLQKTDKIVAFKHSERNSVYEEMDACIKYQKESIHNINKLKEFYKKESFQDNTGLIESTVHIKRHNDPQVKQAMEVWFSIVQKYSERDQLSFNYAIEKTNLKVKWIEESVWNNEWFENNKHIKTTTKEEFKVYFDTDGCFTENNIIKEKYQIDKKTYTATFKNPTECKEIRFDSTEIEHIKCSNIQIKNHKENEIDYYNCVFLDQTIYFTNNDPYFIIRSDFEKEEEIEISLVLSKTTDKDFYTLLTAIKKEQEIINFYEKREPEIQRSLARLQQIEESRSWQLLEKIRKLIKRNHAK